MSAFFQVPCIRCGDCATVCPAGLQPQQLLFDLRASQLERAEQHGLADCSLCGRCDQVCPSHIALSARFAEAISLSSQRESTQRKADLARDRFESRNRRLLRDAQQRAARDVSLNEQAASTDAVAAAIARAKARRQPTREQP
ncbi:MAG: 4Fe-4S dicluster domain-containing protein [Arenimonas sp.]